jgi:uncharacterized membrane protein YfcA
MTSDPSTGTLAAGLFVVFCAGIVRGFSGFGFSALCVAGLGLLMNPAQALPAIFAMEIAASLGLLPGALRDAQWGWLGWLILGNAVCIPLGIGLLHWLPEAPLRAVISALLLIAAILMLNGARLALAPSRTARLFTGLVSGFVNGVSAMGGLAVATLLSTSALAPAALRATMIVLFLFTDVFALACMALWQGAEGAAFVPATLVRQLLWWLPAMATGVWIGQRKFRGVDPERFRRRVLQLLFVLAGLAVLRSARELFLS